MPLNDRRGVILKSLLTLACALGLYYRFNLFIWLFLWPVVAASALWRGRWDERLVTLGLILNLAITPFVHPRTAEMSVSSLAADSLYVALLLVVAVRSPRWWPSWAAAFQILSVTSHLMFLTAGEDIEFWAYIASMSVWNWLLFVALACGVYDRSMEDRRNRPADARRKPLWQGAVILALTFAFTVWHTRAELSAERETNPPQPTRSNPARDALLRLLGM